MQPIRSLDSTSSLSLTVLTRSVHGVLVSGAASIVGGSAGLAAQAAAPEAPVLAFGVGYIIGYVSSYTIIANGTEPVVQRIFLYWER